LVKTGTVFDRSLAPDDAGDVGWHRFGRR